LLHGFFGFVGRAIGHLAINDRMLSDFLEKCCGDSTSSDRKPTVLRQWVVRSLRTGDDAMKILRCLVVIAMLPSALAAQTWSRTPEGTPQYTTDYSTSGMFACTGRAMLHGSCTASGNSLHLTSGDAILDMTFTGLAGPVTTIAGMRTPVDVGTMSIVISGDGPFLFNSLNNADQDPVFYFYLTLASTAPVSHGRWINGFYATGTSQLVHNCCDGMGADYIILGIAGAPADFGFQPAGPLVYDHLTPQSYTAETSTYEMQAMIGIVPEPSSLVLLATGLLGLYAVRRCRTTEPR
jgi:hypothetical protein